MQSNPDRGGRAGEESKGPILVAKNIEMAA